MNPTFTIVTRDGSSIVFTSAFRSIPEAGDFLRAAEPADRSSFANNLLAAESLSPKQVAWLHKLATDLRDRIADRAIEAITAAPITQLLTVAHAAGKRFPRIAFKGLTIAWFADRSCATVKDGPVWVGRIHADGRIELRDYAERSVYERLLELAADPAKVLAQNGVATGQCCLCGRPLSTRESRSAGYGPICAEQHGLPWGDTSVADAADAAAKHEVRS